MTAAAASADFGTVVPPGSLFARLREAARPDWERYVAHPFVAGLGSGGLPPESFRHYLVQDYLFLIQFARAYALAVFKADGLAEMRAAARSMAAILDVEMNLHVQYCAGWGLTPTDLEGVPEAAATLAYTRFVLERGLAGDALDLHVALSPCVVGYAEIADRLRADPATRLDGNPYRPWIDMYAGEEYRAVARSQVELLDRLAARRGGEARFADLVRTFAAASRLEAGFWDMGLDRRD